MPMTESEPEMKKVKCAKCGYVESREYKDGAFLDFVRRCEKCGHHRVNEVRKEKEEHPFPPFNPTAACPKCGYDDIMTRYCRGDGSEHRMISPCDGPGPAIGEHLDRVCKRCGYTWLEATIERDAVACTEVP